MVVEAVSITLTGRSSEILSDEGETGHASKQQCLSHTQG